MTISVESKFDANLWKKALRILRSGINERQLLNAVGLRHVEWVTENFESEGRLSGRPWRPLSRNTIAQRRKGSSRILQDSGRMRASFDHRVGAHAVEVGTPSKIAEIHQDGAGPFTIRARPGKTLSFMAEGGRVFAKTVHHPGLPARPMLPTVPKSTRITTELLERIFDDLAHKANA